MHLTLENYSKGFLIDDELIGGITSDAEKPGLFIAYVLRHTSGEYLGYQPFERVEDALKAVNSVQRGWKFEYLGNCANGECGKGTCSSGGCGVSKTIAGCRDR